MRHILGFSTGFGSGLAVAAAVATWLMVPPPHEATAAGKEDVFECYIDNLKQVAILPEKPVTEVEWNETAVPGLSLNRNERACARNGVEGCSFRFSNIYYRRIEYWRLLNQSYQF